MTITFREAVHPDAEVTQGILSLEQEAFGDGALGEYVVVPLLHHGRVFIAIDEEENIVASAYFMRDMEDVSLAFLLSVAVLPELRGHDVGTALLNYAFSHLEPYGILRVQLTVDPANFNALAAYREKLGFVVVESAQDEDAFGEERLIMEKEL
jgi:ribosomal protein S18 acetylase RimI-like enzyme